MPLLATAPFVFSVGIDYAFQWNIYANDSIDLWVWDASGSRPASPAVSTASFTPVPAGSKWAIGNRLGANFDDFQVEFPARDPACD